MHVDIASDSEHHAAYRTMPKSAGSAAEPLGVRPPSSYERMGLATEPDIVGAMVVSGQEVVEALERRRSAIGTSRATCGCAESGEGT
jgi:hypothetical protein